MTPQRQRLQDILEGRDPQWGRPAAVVLYGAILLSAAIITVQSMEDLGTALEGPLLMIEGVLLALFAAEYLLRLWSAPSRWRYAFSFWGIVDLLAVLPALLFLLPDSQVLRTLRLIRIFRLLKLFRMRRALVRLENALSQSRDELLLFGFLAAIVLFLAAVGIHHFEKTAQPETFGSIPKAMWWALATLTTVGYGDVYPVTVGGRFFTAATLFIGLGIVAIPAGILTSALLRQPETTETEAKSKSGSTTCSEEPSSPPPPSPSG